jgi:hypothetical protein
MKVSPLCLYCARGKRTRLWCLLRFFDGYVESTRAHIPPLILSAEHRICGRTIRRCRPKQTVTRRQTDTEGERRFGRISARGFSIWRCSWNKFVAREEETPCLICVNWCFLHHDPTFVLDAHISFSHMSGNIKDSDCELLESWDKWAKQWDWFIWVWKNLFIALLAFMGSQLLLCYECIVEIYWTINSVRLHVIASNFNAL